MVLKLSNGLCEQRHLEIPYSHDTSLGRISITLAFSIRVYL
jgi:hypothetical protein